ncbi:hypothetical protein GJAV_G00214350 [Gymnothorax javanicus]|nr:hypothetical protein GJAV_G00214350 [Gymnothorax javanicus]
MTSVLRSRVPSVWSEIPTVSELGWPGESAARGTMSASIFMAVECETPSPFPLFLFLSLSLLLSLSPPLSLPLSLSLSSSLSSFITRS